MEYSTNCFMKKTTWKEKKNCFEGYLARVFFVSNNSLTSQSPRFGFLFRKAKVQKSVNFRI